ncbi:MAG: restriction endonuclease subunit S [Candidatus Cloacimonetes bacterium]|nr:restriction endonuclease subunit S [Candidatus Cloacimonadota bacterium]
MKPYPKYRDSGVEGLGEVPFHWPIKRLKYLATCNNDTLPERTDPDKEIRYIDISSVVYPYGIQQIEEMFFSDAPSRARRLVKNGDTIVSTVRTYLKAIALIEEDDNGLVVSTGFAVIRPRYLVPNYLSRFLMSYYCVETIASISVGVSYPAVNAGDIGNIVALEPPLGEQQTIAAFLDRETSRIDALIQKKERMIELLKEKRIALITQTVTKGLDPIVPMKDSGIEWLGELPEHWGKKRIKDLLLPKKGAIKTGPFGSQLLSSEMDDSDVKVYNQKSVITKDFESGENYISFKKLETLKEFQTYPGDFLITTRGTIGRCAILPPDSETGILHPCLMRLQTNKEIVDDRFLELLIEESQVVIEQLKLKSNGTTIEVIYQDSLKNVTVFLPPIHEQLSIAAYLDMKTNKTDLLIYQIETSISLLREYRASLIHHAVTGKIDLRGYDAQAQ